MVISHNTFYLNCEKKIFIHPLGLVPRQGFNSRNSRSSLFEQIFKHTINIKFFLPTFNNFRYSTFLKPIFLKHHQSKVKWRSSIPSLKPNFFEIKFSTKLIFQVNSVIYNLLLTSASSRFSVKKNELCHF